MIGDRRMIADSFFSTSLFGFCVVARGVAAAGVLSCILVLYCRVDGVNMKRNPDDREFVCCWLGLRSRLSVDVYAGFSFWGHGRSDRRAK